MTGRLMPLAAGILGWVTIVAGSTAQQPGARTFVVAQDGSGDATTIGAAVAMAADGDEVLVRPGRYVEAVTVEADITLRGDGAREGVIIEAPHLLGARHDGTPVSVALTIRGSFGSVANLTVLGGDTGWGVSVEDAAAPDINNVVIGSIGGPQDGTAAIDWSDGGSGTLHGSTVSGVLRITGAGTAPVIERNRLQAACIVVESDGGAHDDQARPVVRGNAIAGCRAGVLVRIDAGAPVIEHNDLALERGTALSLAGVSSARITGNTIHDSGAAIAIVNPRGPVTVTDNRLVGDAVGVSVYDGHGDVRIADNEIRDGGIGLNVVGGADPVLSGNVLCGNAEDVRALPSGRQVASIDTQGPCLAVGSSPGA